MGSSLTAEKTGPIRKRRTVPRKPVLEVGRVAPRNIRLTAALAADPRSNYEIAVETGIAPTRLSQLANGWKNAGPAQQQRLAAVLNIPVEQLFGSEDLVIPA